MTVTILQLYPGELGVAGDRGNVLAIAARLTAAGIDSTTVGYTRGDDLPPSVDIVVTGNGPLSAMRNIHADLLAIGSTLREWHEAGVPFFAYGSGAELLGRTISTLDGGSLDGVGLFPFAATRVTERKVGYVQTDTAVGRVMGFEDNASTWQLDDGAEPFGRLVSGGGNGDGREGVLSGSSIATQVGGPVLPLNPAITDALVAVIASRAGVEVASPEKGEIDHYAQHARDVIIEHAAHVFSRI